MVKNSSPPPAALPTYLVSAASPCLATLPPFTPFSLCTRQVCLAAGPLHTWLPRAWNTQPLLCCHLAFLPSFRFLPSIPVQGCWPACPYHTLLHLLCHPHARLNTPGCRLHRFLHTPYLPLEVSPRERQRAVSPPAPPPPWLRVCSEECLFIKSGKSVNRR